MKGSYSMSITSKKSLTRGAALLGATAALAGAAALAASPASAASAAAPSVHPNMRPPGVSFYYFPDCGEGFTVTGTYVNIRSGYGTSTSIVAVARKGQEFWATYETTFPTDGYFWAYGWDSNTNQYGYMATAYLHDTGEKAGCTYLQ
jgi:hypothetical protein